jgi:hypothetical protein
MAVVLSGDYRLSIGQSVVEEFGLCNRRLYVASWTFELSHYEFENLLVRHIVALSMVGWSRIP